MKLNNLLDFSDFVKSWNPEQQKKTKRTEIGLDIIKENKKPTLTKKELQKRVSEEAKRMQQDLKKQGSSWTMSQCKKETEKTFREEFEIKENNEFDKENEFDSDLFWSNWKNKYGSVTEFAKEKHDLIRSIMISKKNTYSQNKLENYNVEDLKEIKNYYN